MTSSEKRSYGTVARRHLSRNSSLFILVAGFCLTACGAAEQTELTLVTAIPSAQSGVSEPFDRATLNVITSTGTTSFDVPTDTVTTTLDLPSGALTLELVIERVENDGSFVPVYFGDSSVFLAPGATATVRLPVFPAGALDVEILLDEENVPSRAVVTFNAQAPRPDQSASYLAVFRAGRIRRVLPAGTYTFEVQVSLDGGRGFDSVTDPSFPLEIVQGEILGERVDLRGAF